MHALLLMRYTRGYRPWITHGSNTHLVGTFLSSRHSRSCPAAMTTCPRPPLPAWGTCTTTVAAQQLGSMAANAQASHRQQGLSSDRSPFQ